MSSDTMTAHSEIYGLPRNAEETNRLNRQHFVGKEWVGGMNLGPIVGLETDKPVQIADVGTGTGIWLFDTKAELAKPENVFCGFDISDRQFPVNATPNVEFAVHDALQPFPSKYHGRFDLVHARLLILALTKEQVPLVLKNMITIMKPGGYLLWEETQWEDMTCDPCEGIVAEMYKKVTAYLIRSGVSLSLPELIVARAKEFGLVEISRVRRWSNENEQRLQGASESVSMMMTAMISKALKTENVMNDTQIEERIQGFINACQTQNVQWNFSLSQMVARKASEMSDE